MTDYNNNCLQICNSPCPDGDNTTCYFTREHHHDIVILQQESIIVILSSNSSILYLHFVNYHWLDGTQSCKPHVPEKYMQ